jgi:hypothetical protein
MIRQIPSDYLYLFITAVIPLNYCVN